MNQLRDFIDPSYGKAEIQADLKWFIAIVVGWYLKYYNALPQGSFSWSGMWQSFLHEGLPWILAVAAGSFIAVNPNKPPPSPSDKQPQPPTNP